MIGTPPCDLAETFAKDWLLRVAIGLETLVNLMTIVLLIIFVCRRKSMRIAVHSNIKVELMSKPTNPLDKLDLLAGMLMIRAHNG